MTDAPLPIAPDVARRDNRVRRPWGALALGGLYGLLWVIAELLALTTLPLPAIFSTRAVLLVALPWLVVLRGARRTEAPAYPVVVLLTLVVTLLGALPAVLFSTSHTAIGLGLELAILLPPGLSLGAALVFESTVRSRGRIASARGIPATAKFAGCGFVLPLFGFALLMVILLMVDAQTHFVKGTGNYGGLVVVFFLCPAAFLLFASLCGYILTMIGGSIGRMLAARASA